MKTHNVTYSSQLIVYLDLELVKNHFYCYFRIERETIWFNGQMTGNEPYRVQIQSMFRRIYVSIYRYDLIQRDIL